MCVCVCVWESGTERYCISQFIIPVFVSFQYLEHTQIGSCNLYHNRTVHFTVPLVFCFYENTLIFVANFVKYKCPTVLYHSLVPISMDLIGGCTNHYGSVIIIVTIV